MALNVLPVPTYLMRPVLNFDLLLLPQTGVGDQYLAKLDGPLSVAEHRLCGSSVCQSSQWIMEWYIHTHNTEHETCEFAN